MVLCPMASIISKQGLIAVLIYSLAALVVPGWGADVQPGFCFVRQAEAYAGGRPVSAGILYISGQGWAQQVALRDRELLSLAEGKVAAEPVFQEVEEALTALAGSLPPSVAAISESEYEPARTELVLRTRGGREWRWAGKTAELTPALKRIIEAVRTGCRQLQPAAHSLRDCVYIQAALLDTNAVAIFQKDNMFVSLDGREKEAVVCLREAMAQPYRLVAVPAGVNPFMPLHQVFAAGNDIEIQYGKCFFQVVSYEGSKQGNAAGQAPR